MSNESYYSNPPYPTSPVRETGAYASNIQTFQILDGNDQYEESQRESFHNGTPWSNKNSSKLQQRVTYLEPNSLSTDGTAEGFLSSPLYPEAVKERQQPPGHSINRKPPNYKPSVLRWPYLTFLLALLLILLGLLVYAQRTLPTQYYQNPILTRDLASLEKRQASITSPESPGNIITEPADSPTSAQSSDIPDAAESEHIDGVDDAPTSPPPADTEPTGVPAPKDHNDGNDDGSPGAVVEQPAPSETIPSNVELPTSDSIPPNSEVPATVIDAPPTSGDTQPTGEPLREDHNKGEPEAVPITGPLQTLPATNTAPRMPVSVTLTNAQGSPTAVSTTEIPLTPVRIATGMTDSAGKVTATTVKEALGTYSYETLTDSLGVPTKTVAHFQEVPTDNVVYEQPTTPPKHSRGRYFIGMFLPTLAATFLSILVRVVDLNAKVFQPWAEMTSPAGASGRDSLCCETSGWPSAIMSVRSLFGGRRPLVFFTTVLSICSTILIPLSSEAVTFRVYGESCHEGSGKGAACHLQLSVFDEPVKATLGILGFMVVFLLMLYGFLLGWNSGVNNNPWSIVGMSSLSTNRELRAVLAALPPGTNKLSQGTKNEVLAEKRFILGYFHGPNNTIDYGIKIVQECAEVNRLIPSSNPIGVGGNNQALMDDHIQAKRHVPFVMLSWAWRLCFLFILLGLQTLIIYYANTTGDNGFEDFMKSEGFGVRFLFSSVGVVILLCWQSFFNGVAIISPYYLLSRSPRSARRSILQSPPTNPISGLATAISRRHIYLAVIAIISIFVEFLPMLLSNIPFRVVKSWTVAVITWRASIAVLGAMTLAVVYSFFVKWPSMLVDPTTIAGAMYYVCDSWMLESFEGISVLSRQERDWKLQTTEIKYRYGEMTGVSGTRRMGVDTVEAEAV